MYECKDHSGSIPVGRVEEFKAKLDQISSANRKGVFVATGELLRQHVEEKLVARLGGERIHHTAATPRWISRIGWVEMSESHNADLMRRALLRRITAAPRG